MPLLENKFAVQYNTVGIKCCKFIQSPNPTSLKILFSPKAREAEPCNQKNLILPNNPIFNPWELTIFKTGGLRPPLKIFFSGSNYYWKNFSLKKIISEISFFIACRTTVEKTLFRKRLFQQNIFTFAWCNLYF